ncbi:hypothetical protein ACVPOR_07380 [Staphylococcus aureus]
MKDLANFVGWLRNPAGHLKVIDTEPKAKEDNIHQLIPYLTL